MTGAKAVEDGRRARARRNRSAVVAAATTLFLERGYVATTVDDVAQAAGVSAQTVYHLLGTKPGVLRAVLDARIAGDAEAPAVAEQGWAEALGRAADLRSAVEALVAGAVGILERTAPVYEVLCRAGADPDVGRLLDANRQARHADQRALVARLAAAGLLGPRPDVEALADGVYAVVNEEVYLLLVVDRGWTVERFARWLADALEHQLRLA